VVDYRISSFCSLGDRVEVGELPGGSVSVRDTKDPDRRSLTRAEWDLHRPAAHRGLIIYYSAFTMRSPVEGLRTS